MRGTRMRPNSTRCIFTKRRQEFHHLWLCHLCFSTLLWEIDSGLHGEKELVDSHTISLDWLSALSQM